MTLLQWFETIRSDCRLTLRQTRRSPLFFGAAILTLALGIGANGAVFSILQSVLLQPLPYDDPARLVILSHSNGATDLPREFSGPMAVGVRDAAAGQFGEVAAAMVMHNGGQLGAAQGDHLESALDVLIGGRATRLNGASVTPNFFRVLGVRAAMGRVFADDDEAALDGQVVLSDAVWRREFGGDPTIVGRPVSIGVGIPRVMRTFTIVGVLPRGVHFTYPSEVEAWVALPWIAVAQRSPYAVGEFTLLARVQPRLSMVQARRLLASVPRIPTAAPENARGAERDRLDFVSMRDWVVGDTRPSLYLLGAVAALLLLVSCVTVANGMLARISERQQELAVRSALGADRSRVLQQLLVEGTFLAVAGTIAGTGLAILIQPVLRGLLPRSTPSVGELGANVSILAFAAVMATISTILAAVAPAWGGARENAAALIRTASGASADRSALARRHALLAAQAALTTMLLVLSSLLLTSLWRLGRVPLGFDPSNVLAVNVQMLDTRYLTSGAMTTFEDDLLRGVRGIPGVVTAGLTSAIPFRGFDSPIAMQIPGTGRRLMARARYVDSAFFASLRVPLIRGRLVSGDDRRARWR